MIRKPFLSALFFVVTGACAGQKEIFGRMPVRRDPFCWVGELQKKEAPVQQPVIKTVVKKVEKKQEMPWQICGVSMSEAGGAAGKCALFSLKNETKIVQMHQEVCLGWRVEKITPTLVQLKHTTGEQKELTL